MLVFFVTKGNKRLTPCSKGSVVLQHGFFRFISVQFFCSDHIFREKSLKQSNCGILRDFSLLLRKTCSEQENNCLFNKSITKGTVLMYVSATDTATMAICLRVLGDMIFKREGNTFFYIHIEN